MSDNEWADTLFADRAAWDEYSRCIDRLYSLWCQYHRLNPSSFAAWQRYSDEILSPVTTYQS